MAVLEMEDIINHPLSKTALTSALIGMGIGPGDEVIVPAYTYTASASVVHFHFSLS